jgi:hypothetical protein
MRIIEARRFQLAILVLSLLVVVAGCAETFGEHIDDHRNCIGEAQIEPAKVDLCIRNTNGHRDRIEVCLRDEMVLDHPIDVLDECVETYAQREKH